MPPTPPAGVKLIEVEELEVQVEKLVAGGDGLARYEGMPIFVPRSAPGDRLRVRLTQRRPDYGRAEIIELLEPGPDRREAPCPHYDQCGGCDLQHIDDTRQVALKAEAVRETLERVGKLTLPTDVSVEPGAPWGYRLRAQLHTGDTPRGTGVGYFARGSHTLVPIERCPILAPELERLLPTLPKALGSSPKKRLDLALGDDDWTCAPPVEGLPQGAVTRTVGDFAYRFDARCFFQGNQSLLARLTEIVVGPWEGEQAYDLYAGVGLFSLPLAQRYSTVTMVESDPIAVRYAKYNARANHATNIEVDARSAEAWMTSLPAGAARVIVDPPRSGLPLAVRYELVQQRPQRLTYVSCHPAALARDLRALERAYTIESLALFDLFPQTGHMEVVAQLVARPIEATDDGADPDARTDEAVDGRAALDGDATSVVGADALSDAVPEAAPQGPVNANSENHAAEGPALPDSPDASSETASIDEAEDASAASIDAKEPAS